MGGGVPRLLQRGWHGEVAAGFGGFGTGQHHMYSRLTRVRVPYHRLQQPSRQNTRRSTRTTR